MLHQRLKAWYERLKERGTNGFALVIILAVLLFLPGCVDEIDADEVMIEFRFNAGDSSSWRLGDYDDSHWLQEGQEDSLEDADYVWVRAWIDAGKFPENTTSDPAIYIGIVAPYEVYFEGELIGSNVLDGYRLEDNRGHVFEILQLPPAHFEEADTLLLALRMYIADYPPWMVELIPGSYETLVRNTGLREVVQLVLGVVYFVIALYYLFFFFSGELTRPAMFFAALLLFVSYSSITEWFYYALDWELSTYYVILISDLLSLIIVCLLIPFFLRAQFGFPYRRWFYVLLTLIIVSIPFSLLEITPYVAMGGGILMTASAYYRKQPGAEYMLAGLIVCTIGLVIDMQWGYYATDWGFLFLILSMNLYLLKQIQARRKEHQASILRSARLEADLLRKCIQPHYMLNSMNAVIDWIEVEPEKGVEFLGALAEEFQVFSRIAQKKEITVQEELDICDAHLKIMACRKEQEFTLQREGIVPNESIPPAIFHTLVENGITHGKAGEGGMILSLKREALENGRRYRFFNSTNGAIAEKDSDGTGYNYIKTRLQESYGDRWRFDAQRTDAGYECVIEIYDLNGALS